MCPEVYGVRAGRESCAAKHCPQARAVGACEQAHRPAQGGDAAGTKRTGGGADAANDSSVGGAEVGMGIRLFQDMSMVKPPGGREKPCRMGHTLTWQATRPLLAW